MKVVRIGVGYGQSSSPSLLALGNFDGVHLGHQSLILAMVAEAKRLALSPAVGFFYPHPLAYFKREVSIITPWRLKVSLLHALGVEQVIVFRFDGRMSMWSPEDFMTCLQTQCQAKALMVGEDFHFGRDRAGNVASLKQDYDGHVVVHPSVGLGTDRISSSLCREALSRGDFKYLSQLLGRSYQWVGRLSGGIVRPIDPLAACPPDGRYQVRCEGRPINVEMASGIMKGFDEVHASQSLCLVSHFVRINGK